jgi:tetratricopeptide (TPR) repeat protein
MPRGKVHRTNYMKRAWRNATCLAILAVLMLAAPAYNFAQDSSSKPADAPPAPQPKSPAKSNKDTATKSAPDQPTWDPLRAEKDLEVGQYYMKRGDYDAAIDRFNDAVEAKPGYAVPFKYLGEAQEKKGVKKQAIKSYTRYLDLYPHAEDADKIRKRIDRLWSEVGKGKKSAG